MSIFCFNWNNDYKLLKEHFHRNCTNSLWKSGGRNHYRFLLRRRIAVSCNTVSGFDT